MKVIPMVMKLKVEELQTGWRKTTTWIPLHFRKFPVRAGRNIFI